MLAVWFMKLSDYLIGENLDTVEEIMVVVKKARYVCPTRSGEEFFYYDNFSSTLSQQNGSKSV